MYRLLESLLAVLLELRASSLGVSLVQTQKFPDLLLSLFLSVKVWEDTKEIDSSP